MIIIPMAGLSSRFFNAGYKVPKYMLESHSKSIFYYSVLSFKKYFDEETFIFIIRDIFNTKEFVELELKKLQIKKYIIHVLKDETQGQADTVAQALKNLKIYNDPIIIFNIDTVRKDFIYPEYYYEVDGYLEVFEGEGSNWSYIKPDENLDFVLETAEKKQISNLCSNGIYGFRSGKYFIDCFNRYKEEYDMQHGELYVAPIYNVCIKYGGRIKYNLIDRKMITFIGTPEEFKTFSQA